MTRLFYSFFLLLFLAGPLFAQPSGTLSGTVTDGSQQPIPHAYVSIWKGGAFKHAIETDDHGAYSFTNLWPGAYNVEVTATGFSTSLTNPVKIEADTTTTFDKVMSARRSDAGNKDKPVAAADKKTKSRAAADNQDLKLVLDAPVTHSPMGRLEGTVVDEHGHPVQYATVIIRQQGEEMTRIETDFYGSYYMNPIWVDTYDIEFSKNGFKTGLAHNVKIKPAATTTLNKVLSTEKPIKAPTLNQGDQNIAADTSAKK